MKQKKGLVAFRHLDGTRLRFILLGIVVGTCCGIIVSLFRLVIEKMGETLPLLFIFLKEHLFYLPLAICVACFLTFINGKLIASDTNIKGSGIPQVEGQLKGQLSMHWFSVLVKKFIGGILSVGSGLFLGREGPSIQLGASIGQGVAETLHTTKAEENILISSGAAAGLAAAFNAPIAGLLFVLEEVHHNFSPLVWITSFTAGMMSNFISLHFFGLTPALYLGEFKSLPLRHYTGLLLMGICLGVLGLCYQKTTLQLSHWYQKFLPFSSHYHSILAFLLLIPIGMFFPYYLGGGNQIIHLLGTTSLPLLFLIGLFFLRYVFSMISYGSGLPGGIFLPILTLGALLGTIFGMLWCHFTGLDISYVKNFLVCAMAAYFAAIGKAPLTALLLITEMVGSITHLMPLGVTCLSAYMTVDYFSGRPIYEALLEKMVTPNKGTCKGQHVIVEFPIQAESSFDGQMIRDITWPKELLVVSIRRGEDEILTRGDTVIHVGDVLFLLTDVGMSENMRCQLTRMEQMAV